jgi:signal transduction histidine kinase
MISVVDQSYQYIIAEGTKTLSLQGGTVVDEDDQLWFGLRTIPRQMGICATALGQFTTAEANDGSISDTLFEPLQFIIPDLSKDLRFTSQPFVCGVPYLRFYAGVPIRSPAGYIIGIYSIVDDKPREDFGEKDLNILKDLAATVMDHLVLGTARGRLHRAERMVKGLGLFVEGKATLRNWWLRSGHLAEGPATKDGSRGEWTLKAQADAEFGPQEEDTSKNHAPTQRNEVSNHHVSTGGNTTDRIHIFPTSIDAPSSDNPTFKSITPDAQSSDNIIQTSLLGLVSASSSGPMSKIAIGPSPLQDSSLLDSTRPEDEESSNDPKTDPLSPSQDIKGLLTRASNLIRESIAVEGCLFLDSLPATFKNTPATHNAEKSGPPKRRNSRSSERRSIIEDKVPGLDVELDETVQGHEMSSLNFKSSSTSTCDVLGFSLKFDPHLSGTEMKARFRFPHESLHRLFKRYPSGGILNFENDGRFSSGDEDLKTDSIDNLTSYEGSPRPRRKKTKSSLKEFDAKILLKAFPGVRCLAFLPLWDTNTNSWFCGSFAWTNDPLRILDPVDDMAYLAAFGNSIMAEKARQDVEMANRMKNNFMSTVSHELRSPLHGILASAELLKDMSITSAQNDVVSMINICGRTLLDTINHVLDFTELNRLRKSKPLEPKTAGDRVVSKNQSHILSSSVNSTVNIDLSILIEEAVDSTLAGYYFGQSESSDILSLDPRIPSSELETPTSGSLVRTYGRVKVILDIEWRSNWFFAFVPASWRRILMNIFGNALKYTRAGSICISLKSIPAVSKQDSRPSAILTISDTGKGMSKQFLKHHAFTPFVQEDSLATGTGLGLSIVEQIVQDLNGQIDIKSETGIGTQVNVQIPLSIPISSPTASHTNGDNGYLEIVRQRMKNLKVYIASSKISSESVENDVSQKSESRAAGTMSLEKSLCKTLKHWFEVEIVEAASIDTADADIYLLLDEGSGVLETQKHSDSLHWTPEITNLAMANKLIVLSTTLTLASKRATELRKRAQLIQQP